MTFDDFYNEYCVPKPVDPNLPTALDKFTAIMQVCFDKASNLEEFMILGSTPSFNDGDPCYHSSYHGYKLSEKIFYDNMDGYMISDNDPEDMFDDGWVWDDNDALDPKVWSLLEAQGLDENIWFTNYKVTVTRDSNGKIVINKEEHYSGY